MPAEKNATPATWGEYFTGEEHTEPAPALANIKEMEARLALYRAGKPYIEVPAKR